MTGSRHTTGSRGISCLVSGRLLLPSSSIALVEHPPAVRTFGVVFNNDHRAGCCWLLKARAHHGGPAALRPYRQALLDFIDDLCPSWSLNVQTFMHVPFGPFENLLLFVATLTYVSVHVCAWDRMFPVRIENFLWRTGSITLLCSTITFCLFNIGEVVETLYAKC